MDARAWLAERPDTRLLEALIKRLSYEPRSHFRAMELGGMDWLGWDLDRDLAAAAVEATYAAASGKHREIVARPQQVTQRVVRESNKPASVADLNWGSVMDAMSG